MVQGFRAKGRARERLHLSPNDVAVVLWIALGDITVLLGSDLERRGWATVVRDTGRPNGKASVFAVITPGKRGGRVVPTRLDKQRILSMTSNAYVSSTAESTAPASSRPTMVERTVRQSGIRLRRTPTPDGVRLRRQIGSGASWAVERFGAACHLRDFAV